MTAPSSGCSAIGTSSPLGNGCGHRAELLAVVARGAVLRWSGRACANASSSALQLALGLFAAVLDAVVEIVVVQAGPLSKIPFATPCPPLLSQIGVSA